MGAAEKITKIDGECTEDLFWSEVAFIGWGERGYDAYARKRELLRRWTPAFARGFNERLDGYLEKLDEAITRWENGNNKTCECGDDSYSDLKCHMVGRGKEMYGAVLADPSIAYEASRQGNYVESFAYCIPHAGPEEVDLADWEKEEYEDPEERAAYIRDRQLGDWKYLDIDHYKRWAQENLDGYRAALAEDICEPVHADLFFVIEALKPLVELGDYGLIISKKNEIDDAMKRVEEHINKLISDARSISDMVSYWGMKNMCSDIERYLA